VNKPLSSNNKSNLSDNNPDLSSDNNAYLSKKKKQGSNIRINIPWEPINKQRLLVYKKEDKSLE
jgi:hypothetical protein